MVIYKMDRLLIFAWLCFSLVASAPGQAINQTTSSSEAGRVEIKSSRVYVFVDKTGLGHQHGVEGRLKESTLVLGAERDAGKLIFDMTSFDADTASARRYVGLSGTTDASTRRSVTDNMKGNDILDVRRYPTATFEISSAKATSQKSRRGLPTYQLEGQFTLHGKTRPLSIVAEAESVKGWLHVRGGFTIKQTDYGITPYSKAFGAIGVANELKIYGDLYAAPTEHVASSDLPNRTE